MNGARRPERTSQQSSLLKAALRIPAEILYFPFDVLLYGLNRFAGRANDSTERWGNEIARSAEEPGSQETVVVPASELVAADRESRPDPDCLRGDGLKLVRSRILFIKRGYEYAFPAQEELIADDLEVGFFESWKVAEFVQRMADTGNAPLIPADWKSYPPADCRHDNGRLRRFPAGDAKYLRVFFEVLNYYRREDIRYGETQLKLLREIGEALEHRGESSGEANAR